MSQLGLFEELSDLLLIRLLLCLTHADSPLECIRRHLSALAYPDLGPRGTILTSLYGLKLPQYMPALHHLTEY
jgi:hypothetical protein